MSPGEVCFAFSLISVLSTSASMCALRKFSYSSFGVDFSDNSSNASNLFLSIIVYIYFFFFLISIFFIRGLVIVFGCDCLHLIPTEAQTCQFGDRKTPIEEEYVSQFNALFMYFLFIRMYSICILVLLRYDI